MKCELCNRQLDENGEPTEYCDWQQGRCPKRKKPNVPVLRAVLEIGALALVLYGTVALIWVLTSQ